MSGMGMNGANQTDNGHIEKMNAFLDRVTEEIVGLREKKMVREEMEDHIEDEAFELMDEGMNESAAYVEAVSRLRIHTIPTMVLIRCLPSFGLEFS